jgi:hypothetical protein
MARSTKWLKLKLKDDQCMEQRYIILHTHFSIYSHLQEQGYEAVCYEASNHERHQPNAVIYINTDHEGFFKSCCQYYAHDFEISRMNADFDPPAHYRPVFGIKRTSAQLAS